MTTSDNAGPRETRIVEMVFPDQTNHCGALFGGGLLPTKRANCIGRYHKIPSARMASRRIASWN